MKFNGNSTFINHIEELRRRIIYVLIFFGIASALSYNFADRILYHLAKPIGKMVFIQPIEAFMAYMKIALFCGLLLSIPFMIYQLWAFVSPGLLQKEKKYVFYYIPLIIIFFIFGSFFAYYVTIPYCIKFLTSYRTEWLEPMISVGSYVSFFLYRNNNIRTCF